MHDYRLIQQQLFFIEDVAQQLSLQPLHTAPLRQIVEKFHFPILFVGRYNAGKSAFMNQVLEKPLLPEHYIPETEIATEIRYGETERYELIAHDGTIESIEYAAEIAHFDFKKVRYVRMTLPHPLLKKYPHVTFVDLPGLNGSFEAYHRAYNRYLFQKSTYVVLLDSSRATITPTMERFLNEAQQYNPTYGLVITKVDKIKEETRKEHIADMQKQFEQHIQQNVPTMYASRLIPHNADAFDQMMEQLVDGQTLKATVAPLLIRTIQLLLRALDLMTFAQSRTKEEIILLKENIHEQKDQWYEAVHTLSSTDIKRQPTLNEEFLHIPFDTRLMQEKNKEEALHTIFHYVRPLLFQHLRHSMQSMYDTYLSLIDELTLDILPIPYETLEYRLGTFIIEPFFLRLIPQFQTLHEKSSPLETYIRYINEECEAIKAQLFQQMRNAFIESGNEQFDLEWAALTQSKRTSDTDVPFDQIREKLEAYRTELLLG